MSLGQAAVIATADNSSGLYSATRRGHRGSGAGAQSATREVGGLLQGVIVPGSLWLSALRRGSGTRLQGERLETGPTLRRGRVRVHPVRSQGDGKGCINPSDLDGIDAPLLCSGQWLAVSCCRIVLSPRSVEPRRWSGWPVTGDVIAQRARGCLRQSSLASPVFRRGALCQRLSTQTAAAESAQGPSVARWSA